MAFILSVTTLYCGAGLLVWLECLPDISDDDSILMKFALVILGRAKLSKYLECFLQEMTRFRRPCRAPSS